METYVAEYPTSINGLMLYRMAIRDDNKIVCILNLNGGWNDQNDLHILEVNNANGSYELMGYPDKINSVK